MTTEFKLVPVEPTEEMYLAFCEARGRKGSTYRDGLRVAIAAAPNLTQPIYDEAKERELARFSYYADSEFTGGWFDYLYGWLACAQSRAKAGEVSND